MDNTKHQALRSHSAIDSDVDTDNTDSHAIKQYVTLKSKQFIKIILFQILWVGPWIAGTIAIPPLGAQWFGGCLQHDVPNLEVIEDCDPDYVTYNLYFTLFGSIGGLVSFLFASFMGRLSDSFGRKLFIIFGIIFWMIPRITLIFYMNFFLYWMLGILSDINGGDQILPSLKASVSDIIDPKDRVNAFGRMHGAMGMGLIIGAMFSIGISSIWNNYTVLIATAIWYLILLIFAMLFIGETIDINNNRISMNKSVLSNPFKPLTIICGNKFILYLSIITFFASLVEAGVMSSLFGYVGYSLSLNNDSRASMVFGIYVTIVSIVIIPISVCFLPFLKNKNVHYTHIIVIAICFRIASLLLLALISLDFGENINGEYILYFSAILHGCGMFSFAVLEGIVSEYVSKECQGIAFGVVTSYKGIASIIAPFSFGLLFVKLSKTNISGLFIIIAILICCIEIVLSLIPLKKLLNKIQPQTIHVGFKRDLKQIDTIEDEHDIELTNYLVNEHNNKNGLLTNMNGESGKPLVVLADDEYQEETDNISDS
eukprot:475888_1